MPEPEKTRSDLPDTDEFPLILDTGEEEEEVKPRIVEIYPDENWSRLPEVRDDG